MAMAVTMANILTLCIAFVAFSGRVVTAIGINYGTHASQTLPIDIIVNLCQDNGFQSVKLYDANPKHLQAFIGSDINLTITIRNTELERIASSYSEALAWVRENIERYIFDGGINYKYVAIGHEPFSERYNGAYLNATLPALMNIQKALVESGQGQIKVIAPLNSDIYQGNVPSAGNFRPDIKPYVVELIKYLQSVKSPFFVNISPFYSFYGGDISIDYAMFDGATNTSGLDDNGVRYDNALDASLDTLVWSMKNASFPTMEIVVGGIGWPTDGDISASPKLAKRFYDGFLKKAATKKGTPLGTTPLEYFGFSLVDENLRSIETGSFERSWGVFTYDGQPKFPTHFSGKGHYDAPPVPAKGVKYLSKSFCVLNPMATDYSLLWDNMALACEYADCTKLNYGGSCNNYDQFGNATFIFNMYYQMHGQDPEACVFNGLGTISSDDPTKKDTCKLTVQIVSGAGRRRMRWVMVGVWLLIVLMLF